MDNVLKDELRRLLDEDDDEPLERILRKLDAIERAIRDVTPYAPIIAPYVPTYPIYPYVPYPYVLTWPEPWTVTYDTATSVAI